MSYRLTGHLRVWPRAHPAAAPHRGPRQLLSNCPACAERSALAADRPRLSERELETLRLAAEGLTNAAVAERLGLSARTVFAHQRKAMARLGAEMLTHAVAIAVRVSLIG